MYKTQVGRGAQKEAVEILIGRIERVLETMAKAEDPELAREPQERLAVSLALARAHRNPYALAAFGVDNFDVAIQTLPVKLGGAEDLHRAHVHICGSEEPEPTLDRIYQHEKVGNQEDLARPLERDHFTRHRRGQIDLTVGSDGIEIARQLDDSMAPVDEGGRWRRTAAAEHANHDAVAGGQRNVRNGKSGGDGYLEFAVALRVAHRVVAKVAELERRAAPRRQMRAFAEAGVFAARLDPQMLEPADKLRCEF